jgi:hypothetical protein
MMKLNRYSLAVLAIAASATGTLILIRAAFGMAGIANALFFSAVLGGPLLLLSSGLELMAAKVRRTWFLFLFLGLLICAGLFLFWTLPGHGVLLDWIVMSVVVTLLAGILRRSWLCAVVGGTWTGALLGFGAIATSAQYLSPSAGGFPTWTPIMFFGSLLAIGTAILAVARRKDPDTLTRANS